MEMDKEKKGLGLGGSWSWRGKQVKVEKLSLLEAVDLSVRKTWE
jgi:hypothetical protein